MITLLSKNYSSARYYKACSRALWDSDLIASRLTLFLAELLWALMLLWPGDTFDRPTYHLMSVLATEGAWSVLFLTSATIQLYIVLSENFRSAFAHCFAGWNAMLWVFVVVSMVGSVYPPPAAIGGEISLAVLALWIFIRPYFLMIMYGRAYARVV